MGALTGFGETRPGAALRSLEVLNLHGTQTHEQVYPVPLEAKERKGSKIIEGVFPLDHPIPMDGRRTCLYQTPASNG